jgi:hypothetical protein
MSETSAPGGAKPFNPTWLAVGILAVTQLIGIGMTTQAGADTRVRVTALESWQAATERRISENERTAAVAAKGFEKDLASIDKRLGEIGQALMVSGTTSVRAAAASPH